MHYISSNFNLMPTNKIWSFLSKNKFGDVDKGYNGAYMALNNKAIINKYDYFHIIISSDAFSLNSDIKLTKSLIKVIKKNKKKTFFFYFSFNSYFDPKLKQNYINKIKSITMNFENLIVDQINFFENNLFSERNKVYLKLPFEISGLKKIIKNIFINIKISNSKPYKLIILDCDNTLWGGILDEDNIENLKYNGDGDGLIFYNFQKFLYNLKQKGFILSISSKNTEKNVWQAMKKRNMILQKKDFINPKINWKDKSENIYNIIKELTLRPKDCLFIDDNPIEISKVRSKIKNINTINFSEPSEIFDKLKLDYRLQKIRILKEDLKKYNQYKIKSEYEDAAKINNYSPAFYKSLKQKISIEKLTDQNFDRALQLFNKTNQFNFSLNRYSAALLRKLSKNKEITIKLFKFKDKFGDHGIIGSYILRQSKNKINVVDFVLSCRVLNRYVEDYLINQIINTKKNAKYYICYNENAVNKELIPIFLKNDYFKYYEKIGNKKVFKIEKTKKLDEVKEIFNY